MTNLQEIGRPGAPFAYVGSLGPWPIAPIVQERLEILGGSLATAFGLVGLFGVLEYSHRHEIEWKYALGIAVGLTLGAFFGARFAGSLSNMVLRRAFGGVMLLVSLRFLIFSK